MSELFDRLLQSLSHPEALVQSKNLVTIHSDADKQASTVKDIPFQLFGEWLKDAHQNELNDPNAMNLATIGENGRPSSRIVLLKDFSDSGFVFYTNLTSKKGRDLAHNTEAALNFHWKSLRRQVRIEGCAKQVSDEEADAYFASRPYLSQIGAWASLQSAPLRQRETLLARVGEWQHRYPEGKSIVPRPPHWSGFCLTPDYFEFWRDRPYRLHERLVFSAHAHNAENTDNSWNIGLIFP